MNFFLKLKPLKAKIHLLKRLVFIAYIDNVIKKTIYHRKNKPSFKKKNPGYGPAPPPPINFVQDHLFFANLLLLIFLLFRVRLG